MDEQHLQSLIEAWFDGTLNKSEKVELEQLLLSSAQARALFWETAEMHSLLCAAGEAAPISASEFDNQGQSNSRSDHGRGLKWWKAAAAAAGIVFFSVAGTLLVTKYIADNDPVAAPVQTEDSTSPFEPIEREPLPVYMAEQYELKEDTQIAEGTEPELEMMDVELVNFVSAPVQVYFSPLKNRMWSTVYTNTVLLEWEWPSEATSAQLEITGMNSSSIIDFTELTTNYFWQAFSGSAPNSEDLYNLSLAFFSYDDDLNETLHSELAVVKGAFGSATVDFGPSDRRWGKVRDNVVIPYDAAWYATTACASNSLLTISKRGGLLESNPLADASGWLGWKVKNGVWGYGTFDLVSAFPGFEDEWTATLVRMRDGTVFTIR
ncbi:MAG: hypothetical protein PF904_03065 [Kiritimatiellae bacterium]|nr:hypothetical protein [Kiritimatiellia bacterium]